MKRTTLAVLALAVTLATAVTFSLAFAESHMDNTEHTAKGGLGFRTLDAPVGIRWWVNNQVGVDVGIGFTSEKINYTNASNVYTDESFSTFSVDVGIPIALKRWDKVHFLFRPGVLYTSQDDIELFINTDPQFLKEKLITYSVTGELELECFLAKNASVSASHGVGFASRKLDLAGQKADTIFGTFGSNYTTLGFHVYLWGG